MPRIISALAIAAALIFGVFIIKGKESAPKATTNLIAEQIQNANQSALQAYAQELAASGTASGTDLIIPISVQSTSSVTTNIPFTAPNATDRLAQNILETYVSAKQSGIGITSDVATQIADNVLSQPYTDSSSAKTYSMNSLTIEADSSQNMKNYGNAIGAALSIPLPADGEEELAIFSSFAASNDATVLPKLDENITRYQKIITKILSTPVPQSFVGVDLDLINAFSQIAYEVQKMRNFPSDPVGGVNASQQYQTAFNSISAAFAEEKVIFMANNIVFSRSEAGYFLTQ